MKLIKPSIFLALLTVSTAAWAQEAEMERPAMSASQSMTVSAVVEAIDHETRVVTVRKADGEELTFTASEEARNLDQVDVGDILIAEYTESIDIQVLPNDGMEPEAAAAAAMARTKKGQMPGFAAMEQVVITATVEDINIEANTFKLKGPDGQINEYTARNPENLKRAMVGDLVVITRTDAVAVVVEEKPAE
jgi:pyridoxine/pyridoxamine 5'-phosphate oxidase